MYPGREISAGQQGMSIPQTGDRSPGIVSEADFLRAAAPEIDRLLFADRFGNWRYSVAGAIGIAWTIAGLYHSVEPRGHALYWAALDTIVFLMIGLSCFLFQRRHPSLHAPNQAAWLRFWTFGGAAGGAVAGLLPWFLPADRVELQLSASAIVSLLMFTFVVSRSHRPLIYASVLAQAGALTLALAAHAGIYRAIPVFLLLAAFVLFFGLMLNRSMRAAVGQRLYAQHLHAELQRSHARALQVQQLEVTVKERQRMMSELHDGFGSQLIASQRLLESGRIDAVAAAALLRECVVDLRLMVDAHEPAARNIATLLGMLRYRLQRSIQVAGIQLQWRVEDLPDAGSLAGAQALDLLRILQEGISNALQHAGAREIVVATLRSPRTLEISVEDDGRGFDPAQAVQRGRGIAGMQRRAARLGADLSIEARAQGGTALRLRLPLPLGVVANIARGVA